MTITLIDHGSPEYYVAVSLRQDILRTPLGLAFTDLELAAEFDSMHMGCIAQDGKLVGCLVLKPLDDSTFKMRQVAVSAERQGGGIGRFMVDASEHIASTAGASFMILHARDSAVPFYLKAGYLVEGEPFEEVGISHYRMVKQL